MTEWLLDRMLRDDTRFLAVVGASGSGKSSLVLAGLLPALKAGRLSDSENWPVVIMRPGHDPFENLVAALTATPLLKEVIGNDLDWMWDFSRDERRLHLTIKRALHSQPDTCRVVLLIDQFEELFTLGRKKNGRETQVKAFLDNILYASSITGGQTVVLSTLRADFYGKCSAYPGLADALSDNQQLVGPMSPSELREAIERPLGMAGARLEPGLTELLIAQAKDQAGGLPLMQHALMQLWNNQREGCLTIAAFRDMGGMEGALEQHAEAVFADLSAEQQDMCQRIMLRLTHPGEGTEDTRRRAPRAEMSDSEVASQVIQRLTDERLLTMDSAHVEFSHEALIRGWSRLRGWLDDNRDMLRIQHRLGTATDEWYSRCECPDSDDYLYRGARLAEIEEWCEGHGEAMTDRERVFVDSSIALAHRTKHRTRRRLITALVLSFTVTTVTVLLAVLVWQNSEQFKRQSRISQERLEDTITLSNKLLWLSDDQLSQLPGTASARDELLSELTEQLAKLRAAAPDNPSLTQAYIAILIQRGDLTITYDSLKEARRWYEAAHDVANATESRSSKILQQRGLTLHKLGNVTRFAGDIVGAEGLYLEAKEIRESLLAEPLLEQDADILADLQVTLIRLGDVALAQSQFSVAENQYRQAYEINQQLSRFRRGAISTRQDEAAILGLLGDVKHYMEQHEEARDYYEKAFKRSEELHTEYPNNRDLSRDYLASLDRLGTMELIAGDLNRAISIYKKVYTINGDLLEEDPGNVDFRMGMTIASHNLSLAEKTKQEKSSTVEVIRTDAREARSQRSRSQYAKAESPRKFESVTGKANALTPVIGGMNDLAPMNHLLPPPFTGIERRKQKESDLTKLGPAFRPYGSIGVQGTSYQGLAIRRGFLAGQSLSGVLTNTARPQMVELKSFEGKLIMGRLIKHEQDEALVLNPSDLIGMYWAEHSCNRRTCQKYIYRIKEVYQDSSYNTMKLNMSNDDIWLYRIQYTDAQGSRWKDVCMADNGLGMLVSGQWDLNGNWNRRGYTFSCLNGVSAKCVRHWGYKPWRTLPTVDGDSVDLLPLYQACVRAARADYCGDGNSHTREGTLMSIVDNYGFNGRGSLPNATIESAFTPSGAAWVARKRWPTHESAHLGQWTEFPTCRRPRVPSRTRGPSI